MRPTQVLYSEKCLALEGITKVNMSGKEEQFVTNVPNVPKHPKFNPLVDGKETRCILSVPIAKQSCGETTLAVLQLRHTQSALPQGA